MLKRSWVEVNLGTLRRNYDIYRSAVAPGLDIMAVVKADAYGHGQTMTARVLQDGGCRNFAVSNIDEAVQLRRDGISGQVLILGYTPPEAAGDLLKYDITQALLSEEYAELLPGGVKAQFAVDTGMNRIGLDADDPAECERIVRKYRGKFELTGLFTHLCVADDPSEKEFTEKQIRKFKSVAARVEDLRLPFIHCLNSAGGLFHAPFGDLVRLGIVLYGLKPDRGNTLPDGIRPVMSWKSVISMVKTIHPGETVGYGRTYLADKDTVVATIPTGYADGFSRALSNKGRVTVRGGSAPVIGRVCMDQIMADVTGIPGVRIGDEVTLLGGDYDADAMAADIGTIGYEVVCDIGKRVPRVYIGK